MGVLGCQPPPLLGLFWGPEILFSVMIHRSFSDLRLTATRPLHFSGFFLSFKPETDFCKCFLHTQMLLHHTNLNKAQPTAQFFSMNFQHFFGSSFTGETHQKCSKAFVFQECGRLARPYLDVGLGLAGCEGSREAQFTNGISPPNGLLPQQPIFS